MLRVLNVNSFCNQICGSWTNSFENWSRKKICNGWLYLYITRVLHCSGSCNFEFLLDKFCRIYSVIMVQLSKFEDGAQHSLFGNNYFLLVILHEAQARTNWFLGSFGRSNVIFNLEKYTLSFLLNVRKEKEKKKRKFCR